MKAELLAILERKIEEFTTEVADDRGFFIPTNLEEKMAAAAAAVYDAVESTNDYFEAEVIPDRLEECRAAQAKAKK